LRYIIIYANLNVIEPFLLKLYSFHPVIFL